MNKTKANKYKTKQNTNTYVHDVNDGRLLIMGDDGRMTVVLVYKVDIERIVNFVSRLSETLFKNQLI